MLSLITGLCEEFVFVVSQGKFEVELNLNLFPFIQGSQIGQKRQLECVHFQKGEHVSSEVCTWKPPCILESAQEQDLLGYANLSLCFYVDISAEKGPLGWALKKGPLGWALICLRPKILKLKNIMSFFLFKTLLLQVRSGSVGGTSGSHPAAAAWCGAGRENRFTVSWLICRGSSLGTPSSQTSNAPRHQKSRASTRQ